MRVHTAETHKLDAAQRMIRESLRMQEKFVQEMLHLQNRLISAGVPDLLQRNKVDTHA